MSEQEPTYDRFEMLYCDTVWCRVNTFERGNMGQCPGCNRQGIVVPRKER